MIGQGNRHNERITLLYHTWLNSQNSTLYKCATGGHHFIAKLVCMVGYSTVAKKYRNSSAKTAQQTTPSTNHNSTMTGYRLTSLPTFLHNQQSTLRVTTGTERSATTWTRGHAKFAFVQANCCPKIKSKSTSN